MSRCPPGLGAGRGRGAGSCRRKKENEASPGAPRETEPFALAQARFFWQGCLIGSLIMFTGIAIHPILTLIITMEISIFVFFIIIYSFAIHRYLPFILWPIFVSEGWWGVPEPGVHYCMGYLCPGPGLSTLE